MLRAIVPLQKKYTSVPICLFHDRNVMHWVVAVISRVSELPNAHPLLILGQCDIKVCKADGWLSTKCLGCYADAHTASYKTAYASRSQWDCADWRGKAYSAKLLICAGIRL